MRRRIAPAVLAVTALFALSGCFKMDTEIEVHSDDTISGSMVMAMEKEAMEAMEAMGSMASEGSGETEEFFEADDVPEGATVEAYDDGTYVGQKMTFDGIALADLMKSTDAPDEDKWSITHEGDTYTFDAAMDMTFEEDEAMMGKMMEDAELRVAVTFPGKVTDTNGDADGRTVVWHPKVGEKNVMTATATEGGFPLVPVLGGVALLALMAAGGFVLYQRHGTRVPAAGLPTAAPAATTAPAAPAAHADGLDGQWGPGQD